MNFTSKNWIRHVNFGKKKKTWEFSNGTPPAIALYWIWDDKQKIQKKILSRKITFFTGRKFFIKDYTENGHPVRADIFWRKVDEVFGIWKILRVKFWKSGALFNGVQNDLSSIFGGDFENFRRYYFLINYLETNWRKNRENC